MSVYLSLKGTLGPSADRPSAFAASSSSSPKSGDLARWGIPAGGGESAGGEKHVDGEQLLLKDGSRQEDLWGAGLDLETGEMDFDSMINLRPAQNSSREILDQKIRQQVELITRSLLQPATAGRE